MKRVAFVLPRVDWIEGNLGLMQTLAADSDFEVTLVAPRGYSLPSGIGPVHLERYSFYLAPPAGRGVARAAGWFTHAWGRRREIDAVFARTRPHCIVVIPDISRELLPFVRIARRRGARVVLLQSGFLAPGLRRHIRGENRRLLRARWGAAFLRLLSLRVIFLFAGMPARVLKSFRVGGSCDYVFVINDFQRHVLREAVPDERIRVTGAPFLDHLHATIAGLPARSQGAAFRTALGRAPDTPIAAYFSRSLEQFYHVEAASEKEAQEFFVGAFLERFPQALLVVKLHPVEGDKAFRRFAVHPRVRIVKQMDVHELIHHSALVISLGGSTPALHSVFHGRPRVIIERVGEIALDYQRQLFDVSALAASRAEYVALLDELRAAGWPAALPQRYSVIDAEKFRSFLDEFDGGATPRVHAEVRRVVGV
ncbi:MAG: hypothetical protein HY727_05220 [Candidatus Rokubacteria bacterium]|nr:hypothetical protein [Candidatus Rokubacteria bacterium]